MLILNSDGNKIYPGIDVKRVRAQGSSNDNNMQGSGHGGRSDSEVNHDTA